METLTRLDMRREFGCDRILARFLEQDWKFESFGNLGLKYTLEVRRLVENSTIFFVKGP